MGECGDPSLFLHSAYFPILQLHDVAGTGASRWRWRFYAGFSDCPHSGQAVRCVKKQWPDCLFASWLPNFLVNHYSGSLASLYPKLTFLLVKAQFFLIGMLVANAVYHIRKGPILAGMYLVFALVVGARTSFFVLLVAALIFILATGFDQQARSAVQAPCRPRVLCWETASQSFMADVSYGVYFGAWFFHQHIWRLALQSAIHEGLVATSSLGGAPGRDSNWSLRSVIPAAHWGGASGYQSGA